ncbi:MAG: ornithine cyclodeaminase family protein [Alteromonadaceae bacterium]|nr:ornithine cyclodeaminase family protein [Alteromonadaceae bacterium]
MKLITRSEIESVLNVPDLIAGVEEAFTAYSQGLGEVPPVAELLMDNAEVHIKYGYIRGGEHYVIKVASGFYNNPAKGLPSSNGLMMLFSLATGQPICLLQDEGVLTDYRTALAGAVAAKHLAPKNITRIGIVGTGTQARLQAKCVSEQTGCASVSVWGRTKDAVIACKKDLLDMSLEVNVCESIPEVFAQCNVVITTTPSQHALVCADDVHPGTLIVAVGSDTCEKQELSAELLTRANRLIVDSNVQSQSRGEVFQLRKKAPENTIQTVELGDVIQGNYSPVRSDEISIVDLTGIALQDLKIAETVMSLAANR